jgi:hypothetical protein
MSKRTPTKSIADLTEALGLPAHEQSAVAAWCGESAPVTAPIFTDRDIVQLARIWKLEQQWAN